MRSRLVVATEALAAGTLTRRDLGRRYTKVHRNVYVRTGVELTALDRAHAACDQLSAADARRFQRQVGPFLHESLRRPAGLYVPSAQEAR